MAPATTRQRIAVEEHVLLRSTKAGVWLRRQRPNRPATRGPPPNRSTKAGVWLRRQPRNCLPTTTPIPRSTKAGVWLRRQRPGARRFGALRTERSTKAGVWLRRQLTAAERDEATPTDAQRRPESGSGDNSSVRLTNTRSASAAQRRPESGSGDNKRRWRSDGQRFSRSTKAGVWLRRQHLPEQLHGDDARRSTKAGVWLRRQRSPLVSHASRMTLAQRRPESGSGDNIYRNSSTVMTRVAQRRPESGSGDNRPVVPVIADVLDRSTKAGVWLRRQPAAPGKHRGAKADALNEGRSLAPATTAMCPA